MKIITVILELIGKVFPMLFAYKAGKDNQQKSQLKETLVQKQKDEENENKVKSSIRDKGLANHIRENDI